MPFHVSQLIQGEIGVVFKVAGMSVREEYKIGQEEFIKWVEKAKSLLQSEFFKGVFTVYEKKEDDKENNLWLLVRYREDHSIVNNIYPFSLKLKKQSDFTKVEDAFRLLVPLINSQRHLYTKIHWKVKVENWTLLMTVFAELQSLHGILEQRKEPASTVQLVEDQSKVLPQWPTESSGKLEKSRFWQAHRAFGMYPSGPFGSHTTSRVADEYFFGLPLHLSNSKKLPTERFELIVYLENCDFESYFVAFFSILELQLEANQTHTDPSFYHLQHQRGMKYAEYDLARVGDHFLVTDTTKWQFEKFGHYVNVNAIESTTKTIATTREHESGLLVSFVHQEAIDIFTSAYGKIYPQSFTAESDVIRGVSKKNQYGILYDIRVPLNWNTISEKLHPEEEMRLYMLRDYDSTRFFLWFRSPEQYNTKVSAVSKKVIATWSCADRLPQSIFPNLAPEDSPLTSTKETASFIRPHQNFYYSHYPTVWLFFVAIDMETKTPEDIEDHTAVLNRLARILFKMNVDGTGFLNVTVVLVPLTQKLADEKDIAGISISIENGAISLDETTTSIDDIGNNPKKWIDELMRFGSPIKLQLH